MSPVEASEIRQKHKSYLESQLAEVDSFRPSADMLGGKWSGIVWPASEDAVRDPITGVPSDVLSKVGSASVAVPVGFVCIFIR
jgi:probable 2-oxoglutarate dehydrogenase E1 component DHKTD1